MKQLVPFVIYPGTCREAFTYYQSTLGGHITFMHTYGEAPIPMEEGADQRIFNAEYQLGNARLRASDCPPSQDLVQGDNIAMFAVFEKAEDFSNAIEHLAHEGQHIMPEHDGFAMVRDRFGIQWMLVSDTSS